MKLAIIGSRNLRVQNLGDYLPEGVTEIVSGGAKGIDSVAAEYAREQGIPLTEFRPDYARYGRGAPLKRNEQIVGYADEGLAFWDGASRGTLHTVECFRRAGKRVRVVRIPNEN